ncbi:MAG: SGNH/GDSL hydrolase family protein [Chloroflexi bacterium]|nr:MAG: SGNH/GDSL hydrolase family protein [Chloroflexota bacterium]
MRRKFIMLMSGGGADLTAPAVLSFTATSPSSSLTITITAFTADADAAAFIITESSTPPAVDAAGWSEAAQTEYVLTEDATYTLYPWVKDAAGNISAEFGTPVTVVVDSAIEFADTFTRADGAVGNDWVGATYAIASGAVLNTPTLGAELSPDVGIENWTNPTTPTNWDLSLAGTSSINQDTTDKHGGSSSCRMDVDASSSTAGIRKTLAVGGDNQWLHLDFWAKSVGTRYVNPFIDSIATIVANDESFKPGASWVNFKCALKSNTGLRQLRIFEGNQASESLWLDDVSIKAITGSTITLTRPQYPTADYVVEVNVTAREVGTMAGIIFALDNPANPLNYLLIADNGKYLRLYKALNGVLSKVIDASGGLGTGVLRVAKQGTSVRVFKSDIVVIDTQTISDAAIKDNQYAGIFSTYSANTFDSWSETVRGAGGSDAFLAPFFDNLFITGIGDSITAAATDEEGTGGHIGILITDLRSERGEYINELPTKLATGGWTLLQVHSGLAAWLAGYSGEDPAYILFEIGANDITDTYWGTAGYTESEWKATLGSDLDAIHTAFPATKVYLAKTFRDGATELSRIATLWTWQQAVIAARSSFCFEGIDNVPIFTGHPELMDGGVMGVHPNHDGYVLKAAAWKTLLGL